MTKQSPKPDVCRLAGRIGAKIGGIDLRYPEKLGPGTIAEIREALLLHKVIFFSGQQIDHSGQIALARRFGEVTRLPGAKHGTHPDGFPEVLVVDPDVDDSRHGMRFEERLHRKSNRHDSGWHVDIASVVNPPAVSVLRCEVATAFGGDTQWTNLVAAYEGLSRPLQQMADGLHAEHTPHAGVRLNLSDEEDLEVLRKQTREPLVSRHPVVRVHPETGERALFLPPASVSHIDGLLPWESSGILDILQAHISRTEYTVRHHWTPGDIAVWDNRAVAHLQPADLHFTNYARRMYRVLVLGDRPVGPDGFVSESVRGESLKPFGGDEKT